MDVFVAGTGSFAAEIADWARAAGAHVVGLIEMLDPARVGAAKHGVPVYGLDAGPAGSRVVLGLGGDRRASWEQLAVCGWRALTIAHPAACLASEVRLGVGATIGPLAVVGTGSVIGDHAIVSRGALVGHHVRVGAFATLNPGVNVGGNSKIEDGAFVGMGAIIVNGTTVGAGAVIAAGAVVLHDVDPGVRVQGVPAREAAASS
jgi:acetyltransferase EpsM